jgi:hypothetical protein
MATVLNGMSINAMREFYSSCGTEDTSYWTNREATSKWMMDLRRTTTSPFDLEPLKWVESMTTHDAMTRPTAHNIFNIIVSFEGGEYAYVGSCCARDDAMSRDSTQSSLEYLPEHLKLTSMLTTFFSIFGSN